jgi:hypothetical protein
MEIHIKLTIDDRLVAAARWVRARMSARRSALVLAACALSATVVAAAPIDAPHEFEAGSRIRAAEINENFAALYDAINASVIRDDLTLEVADCDELVAQLGALADRRIASTATVTVELPEGTFACPTIAVDHVDGHRLRIVGQGSGETTLTFQNDGFVIPMSRSIGLIDKLTVSGATFEGSGVLAWGNASAKLGGDLVVRKFANGVVADASYVVADGVTAHDNMYDGFKAANGSFMSANGAIATNNQYGFDVYLGSAMLAQGASAREHSEFGFNANAGSVIQVGEGAESVDNEHGYNASANSTMLVFDSSASMCNYGYAAWNDSFMGVTRSSSDDNTLEGFSFRHGSYLQVEDISGNDDTYIAPGLNLFQAAERSMAFILEE